MRLLGVYAAVAALIAISPASAQSPAVVAVADPALQAAEPAAPTEAGIQVAAASIEAEPALAGPQALDVALALPTDEEGAAGEPEPVATIEPPKPTLFAVVDLNAQTMTVTDNTGIRHVWKVSTARPGYKTPPGTFTPTWTSRMHYSTQFDGSPMPYSVFFNRGVAVHGTNYVNHLGRPASAGCVRVHTANAKTFYNLVHKHGPKLTQITVKGTPPPGGVYAAQPRRRAVQPQPSYQPFGGLFGYSQPSQQKKAKKKRYGGGGYNTW